MSRVMARCLLAAVAAASPAPAPAPIHTDAAAIERGMLDATKALMRGELKSARAALDTVEHSCRQIEYGEKPPWSKDVVEQDMTLHRALSRARESAARDLWEDTASSMIWVERSCRDCHALRTTSASPSGTGSPNPPSGSTPSQ